MATIPRNEHLKFNKSKTWLGLVEFEISSGSYLYFTNNPYPITYNGNTYNELPFYVEEITEESSGDIQEISFVVSNISGVISSAIKAGNSIDGNLITFKLIVIPNGWGFSTTYALADKVYDAGHIYVCTTAGTTGANKPSFNTTAGATTNDNTVVWTENSLDTDQVIFENTAQILSVGNVNSQSITFKIGGINPYTIQLLQEKYLKNFCYNVYKKEGCWIENPDGTFSCPNSAAWADANCDKSIDTCRASDKNNTERFNSCLTLSASGGRFV